MSEQNTNMNNPRAVRQEPKPGGHPVGVGLGAVGGGAAAGAAGGAVGGPVGAIAGATAGAVAGGLVGRAAAEAINPVDETEYWRGAYYTRPYALASFAFEEFEPAYRYGWESYRTRGGQGRTFESLEDELGRGWDKVKGKSRLLWAQARQATRDAWYRVHAAVGGSTRATGD